MLLLMTIIVVADTSLESAKADTLSAKPRSIDNPSAATFTRGRISSESTKAPDGAAQVISIDTDMRLLKYENPKEVRSMSCTRCLLRIWKLQIS